jgi:isopenicillin-N epimerase
MNDIKTKFLLKPEVTFLNHGSFGATPKTVFDRYQALQLELERQPVQFLGRDLSARMDEARQVLADFLHCSPPDLLFVSNVTVALNIVARNLSLGPGDHVLTSDHEYGAMDRMWRFLAARRGFEYKIQQIPPPIQSNEEIIEALWKGVTDKTRLIFLSHITSPTAISMPVEEICRRARDEGILTLIDGAHAPGQIDLNLEQLDADFYGANLHKWLCAPKGSGFLHAKPEYHQILAPLIVSWGWDSEDPGLSVLADYHEWQGTRDPAAFLAVPSAIAFQRENDWGMVRARSHKLAVQFQQEVNSLTGLESLSLPSFFEQMVAVRLPEIDPEVLQKRLYEEYRIEIPVFLWNDLPLIRISVQGYNSSNDVEKVLAALKKIF